MQRHGARQDELVVIYDTGGMASAARAWWMLSVFSFRDVRVLDGGLPAWRTAGLPVVMHVFAVNHLRGGGGLGAMYRRWAVGRGMRGAALVIDYGHVRTAFGDTLQAMVERADKALYIAKDSGRNRVQAGV